MKKAALALALTVALTGAAYAGEKGADYTIRDKSYRVEGYVRNGKIYDRDYRLRGYVTPNGTIRDRDYRVKGYLEKDNRGRGGSGKSR